MNPTTEQLDEMINSAATRIAALPTQCTVRLRTAVIKAVLADELCDVYDQMHDKRIAMGSSSLKDRLGAALAEGYGVPGPDVKDED